MALPRTGPVNRCGIALSLVLWSIALPALIGTHLTVPSRADPRIATAMRDATRVMPAADGGVHGEASPSTQTASSSFTTPASREKPCSAHWSQPWSVEPVQHPGTQDKLEKIGGPDTIRTCDLRLRRVHPLGFPGLAGIGWSLPSPDFPGG